MKGVRQAAFVVSVALLMMSGGIVGQEKGTKKEDTKKETTTKVKGQLPQNWGQLGLTDEQKRKVYTVQNKYNEEIDVLEAKIKELKTKMSEERSKILTAEQKKRLEEILKAKSGGS